MIKGDKEYIGDGVYAEYDGNMGIWLTTENGYFVTNKIYLEDTVFYDLQLYWKRMREEDKD